MKTKQILSTVFILAVFMSTILTSCQKKDKEEVDSDTAGASDQFLATNISNDMVSISDEAVNSGASKTLSSFKNSSSSGLLAASCASITADTASSAKVFTVDFGAANCLCHDGRNRRGVLVVSFTGRYRDSGTVVTITPQNYFVNDNEVTGLKTITNLGYNLANHLVYSIISNIQVIKANGGGTITWNSNRKREWTDGASTPLIWSDDMYSLTGSASGTASDGNSFTSIIISPLIRNMTLGCRRHFTKGVIGHTPTGKATRYIDFGDGTCDAKAVVKIKTKSYEITLP